MSSQQHQVTDFRSLSKDQKRKLLLYMMGLDEDQRDKQKALHISGSDSARRAYAHARIRLQQAEALRREAEAGSRNALSRLLDAARL